MEFFIISGLALQLALLTWLYYGDVRDRELHQSANEEWAEYKLNSLRPDETPVYLFDDE